ncbi:MAG: hypothetical protein AB7Q17_13225 [Phycisphaerae bacterium]
MEPRCALVIGLLAAAPLAVLVHTVGWCLPALHAEQCHARCLADEQAEIEAALADCRALRARAAAIRGLADQASTRLPESWLPERRRDFVFDQLAAAVTLPGVRVHAIQARPPTAYPGGSRDRLLAAERISLDCRGEYGPLTRALDGLSAFDPPLRITSVHWWPRDDALALTLDVEVAFVPDDEQRIALADAAGLDEADADED